MRARCLLLVPLLVLSACAEKTDKYPFPPQFVSIEEVTLDALPQPPAADSKQSKKEINGIVARQKKLTAAEKTTLMTEDKIEPQMMVLPVIGTEYTEAAYPKLYTLLRHAASDAWRIGDLTQEHWNRPRPWVVDARVQLLVNSIKRPSYPSGHSTTNHTWAYVLSELFPAKREALFARAYSIGQHRVEAGVHFPSDVDAGKRLAASIYDVMSDHPAFQQELAAARAELNAVPANDNTPIPLGKAANR